MTSVKQVAANRRNAAKSTGPKSAAGKQIARMNALKHGLEAERVVIPGEDPEEFEALVRGLEEHCQPVGPLEGTLVERIAHCTWRLQRVSLIETAIMREKHFSLQKNRAKNEMSRIVAYSSAECDVEEDSENENEDGNDQSEADAEALRSFEKEDRGIP